MTFVIARIKCVSCGHVSLVVAVKGQEHEVMCFKCKDKCQILEIMSTLGPY